ncbi:ABC transporter ATP-binding protein [Capillimicrobium parvum]|uniref:Trehalose import ATP-binding protein SugC n=1 Tax=Capillimicrobium parvum TaxID=2884022 RepID=A0A9E6XZS9_9ACTN|nr:sn-glycerol-3-phosphate ABC transporter ATP-binding protein UgpC [Capillimicrobium parvum]UGS37188.1 Trehalose import ATP-binding protein SugC [Capillimicrobium parvum]
MASIDFEHVTKRYSDGVVAVSDMSLAIADGEFMILVGPSGSGKSTALRMVAGLDDVTEGVIRIGGDVVNDLAPRDRDIAMVFQNYALYPHMTVAQNMGFALKLAGAPREEVARKVGEAARVLDIERYLDRKPANLSGGQRQRVAMGRAIVRDPRAFLMDEPLSNLDAKLRVQTRTALSRLHERLGTTTIYVTHDQVEAVTLGDRIAVMRAGRIQQVGTPADVYEHPVNLFVAGFIGSPAMNFLPGQLDGDQLRTPIGELDVTREMRGRLEAADGAGGGEVIVGIRPEHFEDARLVTVPARGHIFKTKIDVLEALGSDSYAHFTIDSPPVSSSELEELADETDLAGVAPSADGVQVVARLAAASAIKQGQEARLWVDTSQLQLFDHETGRSLLARESSRLEVPESSTASRQADRVAR